MNAAILPSIFVMTLLMVVGLFFFIRASVKDRTQVVTLTSSQPEESLLERLQQYFDQRAYQVIAADPEQKQVTLKGMVRPSVFLAVFLTGLAAAGLLCLALVLLMIFPDITQGLLGLVIFSPLAGLFYWQKAGRPEQVSLKFEAPSSIETASGSFVTVTAHRDELAQLQKTLDLKLCE